MSSEETLVHRLLVLLPSLADGTTELLGVPALDSRTDRVSADAAYRQLQL